MVGGVFLCCCYDATFEINVEADVDYCAVVVIVDEDGASSECIFGGFTGLGRKREGISFGEAKVILIESGVEPSDENAVGVESSDVSDGAWVVDYACC